MIQVSDDRDMDQGKAVMVVGNGQIMIYFEGRAFKTLRLACGFDTSCEREERIRTTLRFCLRN